MLICCETQSEFMRFKVFVICLLFSTQAVAQTAFSSRQKEIEQASNDSVRIALFLKHAWELKYEMPEKAVAFTNEAIRLAEDRGFKKQEAGAWYYKSVIYYLTSRYDSALLFSENAISSYRDLNDNYGIASIYNLRGLVQEKVGEYDGAIANYQESLQHAQKTDNLYGQSNPLHNIGLIYYKTEDYDQAMNYLFKALAVREKIGDSILIAQSYLSIGGAYADDGDTTRAIEYQEKALRFFRLKNDLYDLAIVYSNLGALYLAMNQLPKAERYLMESLSLQHRINNHEGRVKALINLADLNNLKHSFQQGALLAKQALAVCDSFNLKPESRLAYQALISSYENMEMFREGFLAQKKLRAISDTLLNEEKVKQISMLETRYQVKEKEQKILFQQETLEKTYLIIGSLVLLVALLVLVVMLARGRFRKKQALLQKENEIAVREAYIRASIESQEDERKRFAQDIHDGMGQLISALKLMLQPITSTTSLEDRVAVVERSEKLLNEMHHEIRRIAFNLMPHTLLQSGLVAALREAAYRINSAGKVQVHVSSFDIPERLKEVQEVSLYRIIQEWVNNVLKYAVATNIEIQIVGHEQEVSVTIEDNGIGLDPVKLEQGSGNGWKNIRSRVNLIKGSLDVDAAAGRRGTTLTIRMPVEATAGMGDTAVYPS